MAKERNARTTKKQTKKTAKKKTTRTGRRSASKGRPKESPVDLDTLKEFLALMESHQLSEFEIEHEDFHVRFCKGGGGENLAGVRVIPHAALPAEPIPKPEPTAAQTPSDQEGTTQVKSPMVGTLYRAPAPDAQPFISVGDHVNEDTVVCIIEAMKVMNEIKAEVEGEVVAFLVENGEPVEFGQPIMLVRPAGGSA